MRPVSEMVDTMFYIIDKETNKECFGDVGVMLHRAFVNIYKDNASFVDRRVAFHILTTQYESYLKKLYYLINGREVEPSVISEGATWKDVIRSLIKLRDLNSNPNLTKRKLSDWLEKVKEWRNNEAHGSYTITEQELNRNINIVLAMYCYVAGEYISDLEAAGHVIVEDEPLAMAAEPDEDN
jgi:type I restriction enzyme R subunit